MEHALRKGTFAMKGKNRIPIWNTTLLVILVLMLSSLTAQAASFSKKALEPTVKVKGNKATIRWVKRSDLSGYKVFQCNELGKKRKLVKDTKSCKITFKNLQEGSTSYYVVRGYQEKDGKTTYTRYSKVVTVQVCRKSTLKKFLLTALKPVGSTMYVWGGGWDKADSGSGSDATRIGVSPKWKKFFQKQNSGYNYRNTRFQIHNGLDCSGYVGWCIYNILEVENGQPGYVMLAQNMSKNFASRGWGSYTAAGKVKDYQAGDIMSTSAGHVWIVVGKCSDGSVVILHSSPPGVQLAGTPTPGGKQNSQAVALARNYMQKYFPEWFEKFPDCAKGSSYLTDYSQMRWDLSGKVIMSDPENYRNKSANKILRNLFRSR